MRKFHSTDIISESNNDFHGSLNEIIKHIPELWQVSAIGWYFPQNLLKVGTLDECLNFLGVASYEEYQHYRDNIHIGAYDQGFWYFELKKVDFNEYINILIKNAVAQAEFEWKTQQQKEINEKVNIAYKEKIDAYKNAIADLQRHMIDQFEILLDKE